MRPRAFTYLAAKSLDEAVRLLKEHDGEAKPLAGGQSLVPLMKLRLASPKYLIDINRIPGLSYIKELPKGGLSIGPLTTHGEIEASDLVKSKWEALAEAASVIGDPQVRNRGTIAGSICHADPAADYPAAALALDAEFEAVGPGGRRAIRADDFFLEPFTTSLKSGELLSEVRLPPSPPRTGCAYLKLCRRSGDFAIVGAAARVTMRDGGACQEARIALGGVGPKPVRASSAEATLAGKVVSDSVIAEAAEKAVESAEPSSDPHASAEYRKKMVRVFTERALNLAVARAKG